MTPLMLLVKELGGLRSGWNAYLAKQGRGYVHVLPGDIMMENSVNFEIVDTVKRNYCEQKYINHYARFEGKTLSMPFSSANAHICFGQ